AQAFSSLRVPNYKSITRMHIDKSGDLEIFTVAVDKAVMLAAVLGAKQAPCSSQAATQPAALEPGPSTPPPAKRSKPIEVEWRPLELCWWPEQLKLPAKGKEYPELGYKRLRDKPLKA
ncbi:uncharacterized protein HaLaN_30110, partial [Haematococcus lacustris]